MMSLPLTVTLTETTKSTTVVKALAGFAAVCFASAPAFAQSLSLPGRTSFAHIAATQPDFAGATVTIAATTQVAAGASGSVPLDFYASPEIAGLDTATSGSVSLSGVTLDPSGEISATATAGPSGGTFTFNEHYAAGSDPAGYGPLYRYATAGALSQFPYLPQFTNNSLPVLELYLPITGAGLVDEDGSFTVGLSIAGDYSTTAGLNSGSGQHYLGYLDPAWNITQDFVYDPVTNLTTFSAVNNSYKYYPNGADPFDQSPQLDVYFVGTPAAPVPEPGVWAMMATGLACVGLTARRRRAAA